MQVEAALITFIYDKFQNKFFFYEKGQPIMTSQKYNWVAVWLDIAM